MASPFGGHPTLQQYLSWLRQNRFTYQTGYSHGLFEDVDIFVISNPAGKKVLTIAGELDEYLSPMEVTRFDRRLGVNSPFPKAPE